MQEAKLSNVQQKILIFLIKDSLRLASEVGVKKRTSKLKASSLLNALIAACFSQQFSLETRCSFLKSQGIKITKRRRSGLISEMKDLRISGLVLYILVKLKLKFLIIG